ncbi:DUF5709 domain-containing protein [Streptomyces sp. HNM0663]|uniref:DUF5709 domain-containing protein n=1 Tax=Streptomyces chengmaiensis TaxID=3040919 RepID=A0ABT6HNF2_9ACTN|nr:DUF5709 domain-containing protein [Streptomyces chengmaiensis]MDH2390254.1 DUF5709 domain-containing protein [Streptomyces chengmaiensis]
MTDETTRGDEVYQPTGSDVQNRPADDLDMENVLDEKDLDALLDEGYSPPERPLAVEAYGTTGTEQLRGETLDQRLAREQPDGSGAGPEEDGDGIGDLPGGEGEPLDDEAGEVRAGRLTRPDDPTPRRPSDLVARDVGVDGGAASAEEAAMHVVEEPAAGAES